MQDKANKNRIRLGFITIKKIKKILTVERYLIIPVVLGALSIVNKKFEELFQKLGINVSNLLLQKTCLLVTTNVLDA